MGLRQQVGNFSDKISKELEPLAPLLKKNLTWEWTTYHDEAFKKARETLSAAPDLAFYDSPHKTAVHVDASRLYGLGFILKQLKPGGSWRMVQTGSRFLSREESRYAMIELECLSAAWAMVKCQQFIEGLSSFELITDHKPMVPIINNYALDKLDDMRLLRLRFKMQRFNFTARWIPGKKNVDADALSRAPSSRPQATHELAEGPTTFTPGQVLINAIEGSEETSIDPMLEKIAAAAAADTIMKKLRETIKEGFPNDKCNMDPELRQFWDVRERQTIDEGDGLILLGHRVVR